MTSSSTSIYGGTIDMGGSAPTTISATFNPFSPSADPGVPFVYQPLMCINSLNGNNIPYLATSYKWADHNLKLDVTLRNGVQWNDGTPFTASDVVFTFNLLKQHPGLDLNGLWANSTNMTSVTSSGPQEVTFTFSKPNVPQAFYILRTYIVPEHIWASISRPVKLEDSNSPVGTGPCMRASYSVGNNVETLTKNSNYWQSGRPYISRVRIVGQISNQAGSLQMRKAQTVENDIAIEDPARTWGGPHDIIFWPVDGINNLYLNTSKAPYNSVVFRKALSHVINKHALEQRAYFGIGGYNVSQTAVVPGQRPAWYDPSLKTRDAALTKYDPRKALQMLESAGYTKTANGLVAPDGTPIPTQSILVCAGCSDYISMSQIISRELKKYLGISTTVSQLTFSAYNTSEVTGSFDMAIGWAPITGPTPCFTYNSELNSQFTAPTGQNAISNWSRFSSPVVDQALAQYAESSSPTVQREALYKIEKVMLSQVPVIVLTNRTGFDLYSSAKFVGWPTVSNPYSDGWNGSGLGMLPEIPRLHKRQ